MSDRQPLSSKQRTRAIVRLVLGAGQIMGATVSLILLAQTGVNGLSLIMVALTGVMTVTSMLLFRKDEGY